MPGTIQRHADFQSNFVAPRHVDVWLPSGYFTDEDHYPVLYMHDGQNLFNPEESFIGVDWGVAETITQLKESGQITAPIVVGIWNTSLRLTEYLPQKPYDSPLARGILDDVRLKYQGLPTSDHYLRFLVEEVKPFIDATYRTHPEREHTLIMGSSMGGLISLYAMCEYPQVFSGAGCLSTHWPLGQDLWLDYLARSLSTERQHQIYCDYGNEADDAEYNQYANLVDEAIRNAGYQESEHYRLSKFPDDDHSERSWRARLHIPLTFFLGRK